MNTQTLSTEDFAGKVVADISATFSGVMTNIGHKLGLYAAMAGQNWLSAKQLADKTGLFERYVTEWLNNQVAGGYVIYNSPMASYQLPEAYEPVLVDQQSPVFLVPALDVAAALYLGEDKVIEVFKSGKGIAWHEHNHRLFCGSAALFRPGYKTHLTSTWLKALENVEPKLIAGARVADIGCGHGASTIVMAKNYPNSTFLGIDSHQPSIDIAKQKAKEEGVDTNIEFVTATAKDYQHDNFDLICFMDCLHDMGDPVGAAKNARQQLNPQGSLLLVEPAANDNVNDNINPVSRLYYAASTCVCTPCSCSQEVGLALGAQAGEKRLTDVLLQAGFTTVTRVAETPFNMVLQAS